MRETAKLAVTLISGIVTIGILMRAASNDMSKVSYGSHDGMTRKERATRDYNQGYFNGRLDGENELAKKFITKNVRDQKIGIAYQGRIYYFSPCGSEKRSSNNERR